MSGRPVEPARVGATPSTIERASPGAGASVALPGTDANVASPDTSGNVRRVRLAIAALTPQTRRALDTAVRIGIETGQPVDCVFVEELELFQAAALPITRELASMTGRPQSFDPLRLEQALRRQAGDAQRELARAAARARLRWTFEVVRGALLREAFARAGAQDVIVVGISGSAGDGPLLELGREALAALAERPDWRLRRRGGTLVARPGRDPA